NKGSTLFQFFQLLNQKKNWVLCACILGMFLAYLMFAEVSTYLAHDGIQQNQVVRSEFVIPANSVLLNRAELIDRIDKSLKGTRGIQPLALVAIGGAGKTVLARQYAAQVKSSVGFEINAESVENIKK